MPPCAGMSCDRPRMKVQNGLKKVGSVRCKDAQGKEIAETQRVKKRKGQAIQNGLAHNYRARVSTGIYAGFSWLAVARPANPPVPARVAGKQAQLSDFRR